MARSNHVGGLFAKLAKQDRPYIRSLSPYARDAIRELTWDFWPDRANPIQLSGRGLARMLGCHRNTADRVLHDLCAAGFLERVRAGAMAGPKDARAAWYRMTWLDVEGREKSATFDYRGKKSNGTTEVPSTAQPVYHERHNHCAVEGAFETARETRLNPKGAKGLRPAEGIGGGCTEKRTYSHSHVLPTLGEQPSDISVVAPDVLGAAGAFPACDTDQAPAVLARILADRGHRLDLDPICAPGLIARLASGLLTCRDIDNYLNGAALADRRRATRKANALRRADMQDQFTADRRQA